MLFRFLKRRVRLHVEIVEDDREGPSMHVEIEIGGRRYTAFRHGPIDMQQLAASMNQPGLYFPWTCECGEPGCAGRFKGVRVSHAKAGVRWIDFDMRRIYHLDHDDLAREIPEAREIGRQILQTREIEVVPDTNLRFYQNESAA